MPTDLYTDSNVAAGNKTTALAQLTGDAKIGVETYEKTAADNDGSVLRFMKSVPVETVLADLKVMCDAIAGATDTDLGIYLPDLGAVLDKDLFMDGQTLASASKTLDGLGAVDRANYGKTIKDLYETVNATTLPASVRVVDIAMTGNTFGTNTGTITLVAIGTVQ